MIDISQIVSNAATSASSRSASNTSNANATSQAFSDALARARSDDRASTSTSSNSNSNSGNSNNSNANTNGASVRNDASGQNGNPAAQGTPAGTVATKPPRRQDKDNPQTQDQAADPAAQSAAAALAALLAPQPAQPAQAAALAPNGALPGSATQPAAAVGAQAGLKDLKDPTLAATAATPDTGAPAASAAADTLATIASQRTALQPAPQAAASTQAATVDKPAAPTGADAAKAAPDLAASLKAAMAGQQGGNGQANSGQQDASTGQPYKAPLQLGDAGKAGQPQATTAPAPANPIQLAAAMRTAEPASTDATPTGAAVAPLMAAGSLAASQAPTSGGLSPATSLPIAPPVGDGQWPQALGQQMVRLSTQGNHTAELQLNPPDLGPLKVVLNVVNDQAQAQFVSPHAAVRAAVEAALPQLRTALADSGIQLGQTSVGADSFAGQAGNGQQQQRQPGNAQNGFGTLAGIPAAPADAGPVIPVARRLARGEVDTFA